MRRQWLGGSVAGTVPSERDDGRPCARWHDGDPNIRGAFYGLEDSTDAAAVCRSVVEAIAFTFADAADSFGQQFGSVPHLFAIGGGARSALLLQLISDATGTTILKADNAEGGPALGAAILATLRETRTARPVQPPEAAGEFNPQPNPVMIERLVLQLRFPCSPLVVRPCGVCLVFAPPQRPVHDE